MSARAVLNRFDVLCKAVTRQGRGLTMAQLGDAHALARALDAAEPDPDQVEALRKRLGLDADVLDGGVS